jgi:hypothetical protein
MSVQTTPSPHEASEQSFLQLSVLTAFPSSQSSGPAEGPEVQVPSEQVSESPHVAVRQEDVQGLVSPLLPPSSHCSTPSITPLPQIATAANEASTWASRLMFAWS